MEVAASRRVFDMFFWRATSAGRVEDRSPTLNGVSHQRVEIPLSVSNFGKDLAIFDFGRSAVFTGKPSLARSRTSTAPKIQKFVGCRRPPSSILQYFYIVDSLLLSAHCQNKIEYC